MARNFKKALADKRPLVFDGAMGTMLQKAGMKAGGCPDELCITNPDMVTKIHKAFVDVGSDILTTNTFGSTRVKLEEYNLEGKLREINIAAVKCARDAIGDKGFVAGDIGPTGLFMEPVGEMTYDEAYALFEEQISALKEGGADLILIETMMDIKETKVAVIAAKDAGMPVAVTMTFDETMRSVLGTSPQAFAITMDSLGADLIGVNCSLGIEGISKSIKAMSLVTTKPLLAQANAGLPKLEGKLTIFPDSPEDMTPFVTRLVASGVRVLGGCCGTTPDHLKAMGDEFRSLTFDSEREASGLSSIASRTKYQLYGRGKDTSKPLMIIGERINPTGRKKFSQEIVDGKTLLIRTEARSQSDAGAHCLDVNVGVPDIDEPAAMKRAIFSVNENCQLPLVIDSSYTQGIEEGLKAIDGKPLINSVSGEAKKLKQILPLAKKYGGALIALALDDKGIPQTALERVKIIEKIVIAATDLGIKKEELLVDCLALTVSADMASGQVTLDTIKMIKKELGLPTVLGLSNISFGLPRRGLVNAYFLSMAMEAGLDAAIMNPMNKAIMESYFSTEMLLGRDKRGKSFIYRFQGEVVQETLATKKEEPKTIREKMAHAVLIGDEDNILALVEEAIAEGLTPIEISNEGLIVGLNEVGVLFGNNVYFLPQVILSAETMKIGFNRVKEEMKGMEVGPSLGKVLMATVEGDIHDIGKNIVCTLLENHGFEVIDLGKNVPTEKVVDEAEKHNVDIVGLSALMTTTVMEMDNVLKKLKERGIKAKTIVGGAVVTPEFAKRIGADEFGGEATEAVEKMKRMVGAPTLKN